MEEPFHEFGEEGFAALTAAFYRRLKEDDVVGPMYPKDPATFRFAEERLLRFLVGRFDGRTNEWQGGPLGLRHGWLEIGRRERDRWLELMFAAMDEIGLEGPARERLDHYFTDTADALVNQDECPIKHSSTQYQKAASFDAAADEEL